MTVFVHHATKIYVRNKNNENSVRRWVRVRREVYSQRGRYCLICCLNVPQCDVIQHKNGDQITGLN